MNKVFTLIVTLGLFSCAQLRGQTNIVDEQASTLCSLQNGNGYCFEKSNSGLSMRDLYYENNTLKSATIYYRSGRWAKNIFFENGILRSVEIFPDADSNDASYRRNSYSLIFNENKLQEVSDMSGSGFAAFSHICRFVCEEQKIFVGKNIDNLHPALSMPIEDKKMDTLERNGIGISKVNF